MSREGIPKLDTRRGRLQSFGEEDAPKDAGEAADRAIKKFKGTAKGKATQSKAQLLYQKSAKGKATLVTTQARYHQKKRDRLALAKKLGLL